MSQLRIICWTREGQWWQQQRTDEYSVDRIRQREQSKDFQCYHHDESAESQHRKLLRFENHQNVVLQLITKLQASLSLPGSPFNLRRSSRGSHQFTIRNGRGRFGVPGSDRKPLVLSTYLDAQEHLPYADDSNAVTPMSEENGVIIIPAYYPNLGSRHSSYCSHASRLSYNSHGDLLAFGNQGKVITKESRLRSRSARVPSVNGHLVVAEAFHKSLYVSLVQYLDRPGKAHVKKIRITMK